jgi:hypothetical protein
MMVVPVTEAELIGMSDTLKNKNSSECEGVIKYRDDMVT